VVVLANARGAIAASKKVDDLVPATVSTAGLSRKVVLDGIAQQLGNPADTWTEEFQYIPMWGYGEIEIDLDTPTPATNLSLTRAVVRVDISVSTDAQAHFSMTKAFLYNYSRAGSIAPAVDETTGYDGTQWNGSMATQPHLPDVGLLANNSALVVTTAPLEYDIPNTKKFEFKHEIYTFEAAEGAEGTIGNTCLVIGGKYKGTTGDVVTTYYRVDFVDGEDKYLALLRNHNYNVQIKEVNGHGYPSADDAYANKPANIVVTIIPWNEGGMNDVEFNGQHYLSVDKSELVFYANGASKSLYAITDFPDGWTVASVPGWLQVVDPVEVDANGRAKLTLETIAGGARNDFFYIVAGNLTKKITVLQLDEAEFSLELDPVELVFYKTPQVEKKVGIFSFPTADEEDYPLTFDVTGNINWLTPSSFTGLSKTLDTLLLKPGENASGTTLGGTVLVTLTDPASARTVTRVVNVKQLGREMIFEATTSNLYPAAGGDQTFTVTSEAPWRLAGGAGLLELGDETGFHPAATGYPYHFTLQANPGYVERETTISATSSDANFFPPTRDFPVRQAAAGPYIDVTSGNPVVLDSPAAETTVTFDTNARWTFATDGDYATVFASAVASPGDLGATPTAPKNGSVTFTPALDGTSGKGGTGVSTVVTFKTLAGIEGVEEDEEAVTFSGTIPSLWNLLGYSLNGGSYSALPATLTRPNTPATNIYFHAATNVDWCARREDLEPVTTPSIAGYTSNSTRLVTVPALDASEKTSWEDNGTGNVETRLWYGPGPDEDGQPDPANSFVVTQAPYKLTPSASEISLTSVKVNVTTAATSYWIDLKAGDAILATTNGLTTVKSNTFTVDMNKGTSARTVAIVNGVTGKQVGSFSQPAAPELILIGTIHIPQGNENGVSNLPCPGGYKQLKTPNAGEMTERVVYDINGKLHADANVVYLCNWDNTFYYTHNAHITKGIITYDDVYVDYWWGYVYEGWTTIDFRIFCEKI
jgi:hypothetical protein